MRRVSGSASRTARRLGVLFGDSQCGAEHRVARCLRHHPAHPLEVRLMLAGEVRVRTLARVGIVRILAIAVTIRTEFCGLEVVRTYAVDSATPYLLS